MRSDFCILIISHGRPDDIHTIKSLQSAGSVYPYYLVLDDQDKTRHQYIANYGEDKIKVFNKNLIAKQVDHYDNFWNLRTTTHCRNACFDIAKELGYQYFLVLDDDYTSFKLRIDHRLEHPESCPNIRRNIDRIIDLTLNYFIESPFASVCWSQGGDWFGGETNFNKKPKRKAMNSWFCSVDRRFWFISRLNEDVNTYLTLGKRGEVFMTIPFVQLDQMQTQKTKGGMTEAYLEGGTYVKSFYTLLDRPDCTRINLMGRSNKRMHHNISWDNAVPMIIREKHKK